MPSWGRGAAGPGSERLTGADGTATSFAPNMPGPGHPGAAPWETCGTADLICPDRSVRTCAPCPAWERASASRTRDRVSALCAACERISVPSAASGPYAA
ncbi:hypothetical protein ACWGH8_04585 [Nonomuraea muscovyensis]|uniref:Uncharacterized protein n=1 Tax=Nonomuraea muscovyensis TaxID=1124761 RepID=A0A7X0CC44_9ACTN|nr:hypothetical protein [Nonomuraea muscovyensis]MBB6351968.1 hypothetical protein [Nonomuraea muscovyensis]